MNTYDGSQMTEELKEIGMDVGYRLGGRMKRQNGFSVVKTCKHKFTIERVRKFNVAPTLSERDFTADQPNQK